MITTIGAKDIFVDFRYKVYVDPQFGTIEMRGAHAINAGGYHEWIHTIPGSKEGTRRRDILRSEQNNLDNLPQVMQMGTGE